VRILIIEDDSEIARLLKRLLERDGHSVQHVSNGDAGVHAFENEPFDVVLCDGLLPKKQGIEVCALIRRHPRGRLARIVMMSAAFRSAQVKSDAFLDGRVDAFLTKPFVAEDLRKAIQPAMPPGTVNTISQEGHAVRVVEATARPTTGARPGLPEPVEATSTRDVARFLLRCARERFEGEIRFRAGQDTLTLVMVRGVVVGAVDNLKEHEFGTWLLRRGFIDDSQYQALQARLAQGGRVADTLVAMGLLTSTVMLAQLEEQLLARVRRSLLWRGRIEAVVFADMSAKANGIVDIIDTIIRVAMSQEAEATSFVTQHAMRTVTRGPDFEHGLSVLAQLRPTSRLPALLLERDCIVAEAALTGSPVELHALVLAEQFTFADEPRDKRPIPQPIRRVAAQLTDADMVAVIVPTPPPSLLEEAHGLCLRVRDGAYHLLRVSTDQPSSTILAGLQRLRDRFGSTAFQTVGITADDSVRELWEALTELLIVFSDDELRQAYDAQLAAERTVPRAVDPIEQLLLAERYAEARPLLEQRRMTQPNDATAAAWLGRVLGHLGESSAAVELLQATITRHPQSILPGLELAELAERQQNQVAAVAWFRWCLERSPDDLRASAGLTRTQASSS
jgi:CheY-like chemotaxis protein